MASFFITNIPQHWTIHFWQIGSNASWCSQLPLLAQSGQANRLERKADVIISRELSNFICFCLPRSSPGKLFHRIVQHVPEAVASFT